MKDLIKEKLVAYLSNNGVDRYGQIRVLEPNSVFRDKTAEILEWNETNHLISLCLYGGSCGSTYKGFSVEEINDEEIKKACYDASRENPTYKHAMTSW